MKTVFEEKIISIGVLATACKLLSDVGKQKQLKVKRDKMNILIEDIIEKHDDDFLEAYKNLHK